MSRHGERRVAQPLQDSTDHCSLVDGALGQGLILVHMHRFARIQRLRQPRTESMPDIDHPFFHRNYRGLIIIVHRNIERGTPNGYYRGGCENPIIIGLSAPLLDVDFHPADQYIEQVSPVSGILSKDDVGVRINLEGTAIGNLELRETVWTGDDNLPGLHFVANVERPGRCIVQH